MNETALPVWPAALADPSGRRSAKPRSAGTTMVIDKGLGLRAFSDLLTTGGDYIDWIKLGFGTAALYPERLLRRKIRMARERGIKIMPGGTLLEAAVAQQAVKPFFQSVVQTGFDTLEVSDGTIEMSRRLRSELIIRGLDAGLTVLTEYGKKLRGSSLDVADMAETVAADLALGASLVTVEGRESGASVGIYDAGGGCRDDCIRDILASVSAPDRLMWETPRKDQQVHLLIRLGPDVHLGNISPQDVIALEALRRGLRSDTFHFGEKRAAIPDF
ncbi:phosphosulfolactate synthase [Paenibacillus thermoaerophilus]|uniref:Phosphosulfolactate synthase n=1 Tax=Paenibacillus thermoaerophilus TaxID=1215385 RepID=A0ABW2V2H7_9BACL|nr:phosphosulfolactate synthase [Paenibacillus thermoaerophilus]TMV18794.1 phosphosulfolactate synthase [Paenibacillus thermoaerophilus]